MHTFAVRATLAVIVVLLAVSASVGAPSVRLVGAGLIGTPLPGKTIDSPSDFGFAVSAEGGTFVCSMAGPLTGGFKGLTVMTVEGPITAGTLTVTAATATFKGNATVVLVPGMDKSAVQILPNIPFTVTVGVGGPGKAWLIMKVPQFTQTLGGDTGGLVKMGSISTSR